MDTTEDTQTFQTDQDEAREVRELRVVIFLLTCGYFQVEGGGGRQLAGRLDTRGSTLVGDKFTRVKKINDVTESLVKTEALQNLGDIKSRVRRRNKIVMMFLEKSENLNIFRT